MNADRMRLLFGLCFEREVVMCKYIFDASRIDTTPGNSLSPFSPPHGWDSGTEHYRDWLRTRFKSDPNLRQRLGIAVRSLNLNRQLTISGDFKIELQEILEQLRQKGR